MTKFLLTAIGSHGDVHPMVGLGVALRARGHEAKIITNPYFAEVVKSAGLEMLPVGTLEEYLSIGGHSDLWHPIRGTRLIFKRVAGRLLRPLYTILKSQYAPGQTVFCAHALDLASRVAGEKLGAPVACVDFAPSMFWSRYDSPKLKGMLFGPRIPRFIKYAQFWATDTLIVKSMLDPEFNELRHELGLPPVKRVFSRWIHQTDLVLGLFSPWFGTPQPDWPANVRLVGFPLWDTASETELAQDVQAFLAAGAAPVVFSPGTANQASQQFFTSAIEACEQSGWRGILLSKYADQIPDKLPQNIRHFSYVPLSRLLPHCAALVHHGGIGNCAQGLAVGIPHLVRPMAFDQFDNSRRLVRLGVAEELTREQFHAKAIAASLTRLLNSTAVASNCRAFAAKCDGAAALDAACDALEELASAHAAA